jgi:2-oxoglutarate dehydrogenase E2 component (dihydrolipoamide succinyltransferase)
MNLSTDVVMPQMGESIAEGTIVRWIKKVGDAVERDEPLFEISTDKVDAEIPSPVAGVLIEIRAAEGQTVPVNSIVAVIGQTRDAQDSAAAANPPPPSTQASQPEPARSAPSLTPARGESAAAPLPLDDAVRQRSSPLVRRLAQEHGVDLSLLTGTGMGGRVTKDDILAFVASRQPAAARVPDSAAEARVRPGQVVPMSIMRRKIAEHMVSSLRTSAHTHTVFEVDFEAVGAARQARKAEIERAGAKLTYLSFILKAAAGALRAVPIVNASLDGDSIVYHEDVNIGIAVALDWGLIVPVILHADRKDLASLSHAIADLAERARSKRLKPEEVTGGTFTITNPGASGALFGTPIINQPQVAILGVGSIQKRAVVAGDAVKVRLSAHLSLGFDHRVVDGAVADAFMTDLKRRLESWDESAGR